MGLCPMPRPLFLKKWGKNNFLPAEHPTHSVRAILAGFFFYVILNFNFSLCARFYAARTGTFFQKIKYVIFDCSLAIFTAVYCHLQGLYFQTTHEGSMGLCPMPCPLFLKKWGRKIIFCSSASIPLTPFVRYLQASFLNVNDDFNFSLCTRFYA